MQSVAAERWKWARRSHSRVGQSRHPGDAQESRPAAQRAPAHSLLSQATPSAQWEIPGQPADFIPFFICFLILRSLKGHRFPLGSDVKRPQWQEQSQDLSAPGMGRCHLTVHKSALNLVEFISRNEVLIFLFHFS